MPNLQAFPSEPMPGMVVEYAGYPAGDGGWTRGVVDRCFCPVPSEDPLFDIPGYVIWIDNAPLKWNIARIRAIWTPAHVLIWRANA